MGNAVPQGIGRAAVLGDGGWGTALAVLLSRKGTDVTIWGNFPDYVEEMRRSRVNRKFLPGIDLPEGLALESDAAAATRGAELIVVAIPTKFARATLERIAAGLPRDVPYVSVAKAASPARPTPRKLPSASRPRSPRRRPTRSSRASCSRRS
jgi:glycerol-3-phosphate dehydrogenase